MNSTVTPMPTKANMQAEAERITQSTALAHDTAAVAMAELCRQAKGAIYRAIATSRHGLVEEEAIGVIEAGVPAVRSRLLAAQPALGRRYGRQQGAQRDRLGHLEFFVNAPDRKVVFDTNLLTLGFGACQGALGVFEFLAQGDQISACLCGLLVRTCQPLPRALVKSVSSLNNSSRSTMLPPVAISSLRVLAEAHVGP